MQPGIVQAEPLMHSYGSIHFRDVDRAALLREVGKMASQRQINFLIGPDLDGWTAVYPAPHGQDSTMAAELAKVLNASALHLLVHDGAFLAYNYYRGAEWIHGYNTRPSYFDENPWPDARPRLHGGISALSELVGRRINLTYLSVTLFRLAQNCAERPVEAKHLAEVANTLGIQNAVTSYTRLLAGEWKTIAKREDFVHVPDRHDTDHTPATAPGSG